MCYYKKNTRRVTNVKQSINSQYKSNIQELHGFIKQLHLQMQNERNGIGKQQRKSCLIARLQNTTNLSEISLRVVATPVPFFSHIFCREERAFEPFYEGLI